MECVGPLTLVYIMMSLPKEVGIAELPMGNWTMAGCFVSFWHMAVTIVQLTVENSGHSLCLSGHHLAAAAQPQHVAHAHSHLDIGGDFPAVQRDFDRRLSGRVRADVAV